MAIYHLSAQIIGRSAGRSVMAAAAYRSGERLHEERTGQVHDYTKRKEIESEIHAPENAPGWMRERERLWNAVDAAEKRKDAQLAREFNMALPKELDAERQRELVRRFVKEEMVNRGMVADVAFHRDHPGNPHAHVMVTMREAGPEGFGPKNRDWNRKDLLEAWRETWAAHANRELERAGRAERIDHRTLKAQGIDREPTRHLGPAAAAMERKHLHPDRGRVVREVQEYNRNLIDFQAAKAELERLRDQRERQEKIRASEGYLKRRIEHLEERAGFLTRRDEHLSRALGAGGARAHEESRSAAGIRAEWSQVATARRHLEEGRSRYEAALARVRPGGDPVFEAHAQRLRTGNWTREQSRAVLAVERQEGRPLMPAEVFHEREAASQHAYELHRTIEGRTRDLGALEAYQRELNGVARDLNAAREAHRPYESWLSRTITQRVSRVEREAEQRTWREWDQAAIRYRALLEWSRHTDPRLLSSSPTLGGYRSYEEAERDGHAKRQAWREELDRARGALPGALEREARFRGAQQAHEAAEKVRLERGLRDPGVRQRYEERLATRLWKPEEARAARALEAQLGHPFTPKDRDRFQHPDHAPAWRGADRAERLGPYREGRAAGTLRPDRSKDEELRGVWRAIKEERFPGFKERIQALEQERWRTRPRALDRNDRVIYVPGRGYRV